MDSEEIENSNQRSNKSISLADRILSLLKATNGLKANQMAFHLNTDPMEINSLLYGKLRDKVWQDKLYRWWLRSSKSAEQPHISISHKDTILSKICRYYLDCLSHDDIGGVSDFATSIYGDLNYVDIEKVPMLNESDNNPFASESSQQLLTKIRRDRNRQNIFLGYPVRLKFIRSKKGWEGFMVEPLLLFPFQDTDNHHEAPILSDDLPQINFKALNSLSNVGEAALMSEAIQLSEELGLSNTGDDQPEVDELLYRLQEIRSDWDWKERIEPHELSKGVPLSEINQQGIFNRAILIAAERSPYTKGLESELAQLQDIEQDKYKASSLGSWLLSENIQSPSADQQPLIEVLQLNSEQRQAVRQALCNQLTVITGPPGTGKSQVVTSILINAAWQGKTVLFASKNNKAVDVVEARVNALGPRPILLRLGPNEYRNRLAEYLLSLLSSTTTLEDFERYKECEEIHAKLKKYSDSIDTEISSIINLRNEVDKLEQQVEGFRSEVNAQFFSKLRDNGIDQIIKTIEHFQSVIDRANKNKQSFLINLAWFFIRNRRFADLYGASVSFKNLSQNIALCFPELNPDSTSINDWIKYGENLSNRISQIESVKQYFSKLLTLTSSRSLEDFSQQYKKLTESLCSNSEELWSMWLRLQPSRLTPAQRKILGDYSAVLQMIVSADEQNQRIGRDLFRRYYQLFPQITSIFPCWAVTSLSARGRVPFEPNFFDILVIDEASQCDIASALPLLYRAKKVVIIGDPMQLRHISTLSVQKDQQLLSKYVLMEDFPKWGYSKNSLFDLACRMCRSEDIVSLRDHHRSHSDIIEFSNDLFYEGRLRIATKYDKLNRPWHNEPAIRWIDIRGKTIRPDIGGAVNEDEARTVVSEIERLVNQQYRGSIGVVSPFRAQANRIRDLVLKRDDLTKALSNADFLSDAVHSFQGDERDVMIFSPTVSDDTPRGALWFLDTYPNLFNVAITRARSAFIVVGNKSAALNCGVDYLARFASYVENIRNHKLEMNGQCISNFGPEYPIVPNPERVSEWERLFYRKLYQVGIRPIPQYLVEKYALDFALIIGDRRLNIEVDGERYHRNWDGELCRRDQIRNQRLMELGWDIMRFWVYQIRDDIETCITKVQQWYKK